MCSLFAFNNISPKSKKRKEQKELAAKRYTLCDEYYSLKEEIPSMETIRRSIETIMRDEPNRAQPTRSQGKAL